MNATSNRVVVYIQTEQNLNLLPQCYANLTAINLSAFHFGYDEINGNKVPYIHLNDNPPGNPMYDNLWKQMHQAQKNGVLLIAMLGGAGLAYNTLFEDYTTFYPMFVNMLKTYQFDGVDLDVEEEVTTNNIQMLISDLRKDFPTNFYITAAPVCKALKEGKDPFTSIDWFSLRNQIDWFNVQFYSNYGSLKNVSDYMLIIEKGYDPKQIVGGALTNPDDGYGYVPMSIVIQTLKTLNQRFGKQMGGAMGWEYFNANNPSENSDPVGWCAAMKQAVS